jgi:hypothetical protein
MICATQRWQDTLTELSVAHNARFDLSWIDDSGCKLRKLDISSTKVVGDKERLTRLLLKFPLLRDIGLDHRQWRAVPAANRAKQDSTEQRCTADLLRAELLTSSTADC